MNIPRKITIVYVIDFLTTREGIAGGTEKQLVETITHLNRKEFAPILVCLQQYEKTPCWENLSCQKHVANVYTFTSFKSFLSLISFAAFLRNNRVDIVQTFFFDSTVFGVLGARLAGVKHIVSCRRDLGFWCNKKILKNLRFINRFATSFLVNSKAVKDYIVRSENVPEESVDIIYNGIDLKSFDDAVCANLSREFTAISDQDLVVGLVANLNRRVKRVDLFIRVAAEVCQYIKNVKFLVIGAGELQNELRHLVMKLGLEKVLVFAGKKNNAIPYIKGFDVAALTSDSEGFSNVILEYMAAAIPTVATDVGGNRELIRNHYTGILVPQGDYQSMAKEICSLLSDKDRRAQMGREARHVVEQRYSWNMVIPQLESFYHTLLATS